MRFWFASACVLALLGLAWLWLRNLGQSDTAAPVSDGSGGSGNNALDNIAQAINNFEGNSAGAISTRNNNPGNLVSGPNMIGTNGGFAVFSDIGDGWDALIERIQSWANANPDADFYDFFSIYAPASAGNNPDEYADYVANYLGVPATLPVASALQQG